MATAMRDTSLAAYDSIRSLGDKQQAVYEAIRRNKGCSDKEIAQMLGWEINRVTGRRNELEKKGLVFDYGKKMDFDTRTLVHAWSADAGQDILVF